MFLFFSFSNFLCKIIILSELSLTPFLIFFFSRIPAACRTRIKHHTRSCIDKRVGIGSDKVAYRQNINSGIRGRGRNLLGQGSKFLKIKRTSKFFITKTWPNTFTAPRPLLTTTYEGGQGIWAGADGQKSLKSLKKCN